MPGKQGVGLNYKEKCSINSRITLYHHTTSQHMHVHTWAHIYIHTQNIEKSRIVAHECCAETSSKMAVGPHIAEESQDIKEPQASRHQNREDTTNCSSKLSEDVTFQSHKGKWILCPAILIDYNTYENTKGKNTVHDKHWLWEPLVQRDGVHFKQSHVLWTQSLCWWFHFL